MPPPVASSVASSRLFLRPFKTSSCDLSKRRHLIAGRCEGMRSSTSSAISTQLLPRVSSLTPGAQRTKQACMHMSSPMLDMSSPMHMSSPMLAVHASHTGVLAGVWCDLPDGVWNVLQRRLDLELASLATARGSIEAQDMQDAETTDGGLAEDSPDAAHGQQNAGHASARTCSGNLGQALDAWEDWYACMDHFDHDFVHHVQRHGVVSVEQLVAHEMQDMPMEDAEQFYMELEGLEELPGVGLPGDEWLASSAHAHLVARAEHSHLVVDAQSHLAVDAQQDLQMFFEAASTRELPCCPPSATGHDEQNYRVLAPDEDELWDGLALAGRKSSKKKGKNGMHPAAGKWAPSKQVSPQVSPPSSALASSAFASSALASKPAPRGGGGWRAGAGSGAADAAQLSPPVQSLALIQQREEEEARCKRQGRRAAGAPSFPATWGGRHTSVTSVASVGGTAAWPVGALQPGLTTEARAAHVLTATRPAHSSGPDAAGWPAVVRGAGGAAGAGGGESSTQGGTSSGAPFAAVVVAPKQTTSKAQAGAAGTFSLLDLARGIKPSRRSKAGGQKPPQESPPSNPFNPWQMGGSQHGLDVSAAAHAPAEPHSAPPSSLSLAAIQTEQGGGKQARGRGKVKRPISRDHAWRNELNVAPAPSVDEMQRREVWEAEEREALDLIRAVYGEAAVSPPC